MTQSKFNYPCNTSSVANSSIWLQRYFIAHFTLHRIWNQETEVAIRKMATVWAEATTAVRRARMRGNVIKFKLSDCEITHRHPSNVLMGVYIITKLIYIIKCLVSQCVKGCDAEPAGPLQHLGVYTVSTPVLRSGPHEHTALWWAIWKIGQTAHDAENFLISIDRQQYTWALQTICPITLGYNSSTNWCTKLFNF